VEVSEQVKTFMSRHQTTGQNHYIKEDNKWFESVAKLK
jgi:hypothetical protein